MNIQELKEQIIKKQLQHFYVFTGEEIGIINIYLNQISKVTNLPITRADSVASIYSKCTTKSMFGNSVGLYVIRDDFDFQKQDKYFESVKNDLGKNFVILLYEKLDSRLKFSKYFKDCTVLFEKLSNTVLYSYIQKAGKVSLSNAEKLGELCKGSYDVAMLECDKIIQYGSSKNLNSDEAFLDLIREGAIYQPENSDVFQFTAAVCNGDAKLAYEIADILNTAPGASINILGTLYSTLKSVMLIQCCEGNISEVTGLDNGQIYFNKRYVGKHSIEWLVAAVKLLIKVIDGIKRGWIDDMYATKYVLAQIL